MKNPNPDFIPLNEGDVITAKPTKKHSIPPSMEEKHSPTIPPKGKKMRENPALVYDLNNFSHDIISSGGTPWKTASESYKGLVGYAII